jgi:hypothetical protein
MARRSSMRACRTLGGDQAAAGTETSLSLAAILNTGQQRLGLGERQADRLQPVVVLVEQQKLGIVADHALVLRDNPELNLERTLMSAHASSATSSDLHSKYIFIK